MCYEEFVAVLGAPWAFPGKLGGHRNRASCSSSPQDILVSGLLGCGGVVLVGTEGLVEVDPSFLGDPKGQGYTQRLLWTP